MIKLFLLLGFHVKILGKSFTRRSFIQHSAYFQEWFFCGQEGNRRV